MTNLRSSTDGTTPATPASASHAGPASPTTTATGVLWPLRLDQVRLAADGMLGGWQRRNALATLPHCIEQVEETGKVDNVRRVLDGGDRPFAGMWFADSDIHKTLEAAAWQLAAVDADPALRRFLAATTELLANAQDADGYLNSYFQVDHPEKRWQELDWSHELYCAGHLIQAAVAADRTGCGEELMAVARRFADLLVERFGQGGTDAVCGHPEIETALVELYRATGHRPYLDLAGKFVDLRGTGLLAEGQFGRAYFQDHLPVREAKEVTGHAVRQLYLLAGMVDVAVETGDRGLLDAAERLWDSAFTTKTYLTGGHGARHRDEAFGDPYELPPDRAYAETCAAIASFQWNWRLLLATGRHRYADEMERVLYNGIAGATAVDGRHFFYSNPLQLRTGHDGSEEDAPSRRLPWYRCPCCPPNLARLVAALHAHVATSDDAGIQLHLYGQGSVDTGGFALDVWTSYPWSGRVALTVRRAPGQPRTLALRVPGWCDSYTVTVDGVTVEAPEEGGYVRLTRDWVLDTTVVLDLHMPARLVEAHPYVDAVRGCVAMARGPLVYCLEQADLPAGVVLEDVRLDTGAAVCVVEHEGTGAVGGWPVVPVTLAATGTVSPPPGSELYRDRAPAGGRDGGGAGARLDLTAIPYFLWGNRTSGPMRVWIPSTTG